MFLEKKGYEETIIVKAENSTEALDRTLKMLRGGKLTPFEHVEEFRLRKHGAMAVLEALENEINNIELFETNNTRRYKLLKEHIKRAKTDLNYVVEHRYCKYFKYEFEKGKLIVKE